jgi:hypothetical protein
VIAVSGRIASLPDVLTGVEAPDKAYDGIWSVYDPSGDPLMGQSSMNDKIHPKTSAWKGGVSNRSCNRTRMIYQSMYMEHTLSTLKFILLFVGHLQKVH